MISNNQSQINIRRLDLVDRNNVVDPASVSLLEFCIFCACVLFIGHLGLLIVMAPVASILISNTLNEQKSKTFYRQYISTTALTVVLLLCLNAVIYIQYLDVLYDPQEALGLMPMAIVACVSLTNLLLLPMTPTIMAMMGGSTMILLLVQLAISQSIAQSLMTGLIFFLIWAAMGLLYSSKLENKAPSQIRRIWRSVISTAVSFLLALPLMVMFVVLFPRMPLDGMGIERQQGGGAKTGLSDSLSLGSISELRKSQDPAFVATFSSGFPSDNNLYWRSMVLDKLDGQRWISSIQNSPLDQAPIISTNGSPVAYTINWDLLNANDQLPVLDGTAERIFVSFDEYSASLVMRSDGTYSMQKQKQILGRNKVKISSLAAALYNSTSLDDTDTVDTSKWLQLPPEFNPRTQAMGRTLRANASSDTQIINRTLQFFNSQPFYYTLRPARLGRQAIDDFIFETKSGFCEHYASAFVVLMRSAGIPARLVAGYLSNGIKDSKVRVLQSDAHAWAEVWLKGRGWVRQDPTAYIHPSRVDPDASNPILESTPNSFLGFLGLNWRKNIFLADQFWRNNILDFDAQGQEKIFNMFGLDKSSRPLITAAALAIILFISLAWQRLTKLNLFNRRSINNDIIANMIRQRCNRAGIQASPGTTLRALAQLSRSRIHPDDVNELLDIVFEYERITYGQTSTIEDKDKRKLIKRIRKFRPTSNSSIKDGRTPSINLPDALLLRKPFNTLNGNFRRSVDRLTR